MRRPRPDRAFKALYLGPCLLNGALSLSAVDGVHPAGIECHAVGFALWEENAIDGVTLTADHQTAAQAIRRQGGETSSCPT
jgi:hypothetical protein